MTLPQAAIDLLDHPKAHATIITTNSKGQPQVTLVWVEALDGTLSFNTALGRQKVKNLQHNPRLVVSVQNPDALREYAVFEGTANLTEDGADEQIDRLARKYTDEERYPWRKPEERRVRVDVDVRAIKGMGPWVGE